MTQCKEININYSRPHCGKQRPRKKALTFGIDYVKFCVSYHFYDILMNECMHFKISLHMKVAIVLFVTWF